MDSIRLEGLVRELEGRVSFDGFELVVVSGGTLSGLRHAYSDLDLYAVPKAGNTVESSLHQISGIVVQLNVISRDSFDQIIETYRSFRISTIDKSQIHDHLRWQKLGSRFVTGVKVHSTDRGASEFNQISRDAYRHLVMTCSSIQMGRMLEDALGGLRSSDLLIADRAADIALAEGLSVVLAGVGELHYGESLLWRRVFTHPALSHLGHELYAMTRITSTNMSESSQLIRSIVARCSTASFLASKLVLDAWEVEAERVDVDLSTVMGDGVQRSPFVHILRLSDAMSLTGLDKAYRTNIGTANAWLQADGRTRLPESVEEQFLRRGLLVNLDEFWR
ncbi:hypothetical protein ABH924_004331 [Arthrobacter sp. GAS37]|uniref:hypothetical protein n=1 Tax=Arthrobacter sp. GAS37 TaxID=3156261 RepID=UPI0038342766